MEEMQKLTLRLERKLIEATESYAQQHHTTVSELIITYLQHLTAPEAAATDLPVLRRLSGILPADVRETAYADYLAEKYDD